MQWQVWNGDCTTLLRFMEPDSVDAVVCDPPYDLTTGTGKGFMGKTWDGTGIAFRVETWSAVLRVLKPGGHLVAFGGTRTFHRLWCAVEDAGFEIRETFCWLHGQGFPKSRGLPKPSWEPIVLARRRGVRVAPLNIDATRIAAAGETLQVHGRSAEAAKSKGIYGGSGATVTERKPGQVLGRWPSNVVLEHLDGCTRTGTREVSRTLIEMRRDDDLNHGVYGLGLQGSRRAGATTETIDAWTCVEGCPVAELDAQAGFLPGAGNVRQPKVYEQRNATYGQFRGHQPFKHDDGGSASRFFYQAKADNGERWGLCRTCDAVINRRDDVDEHKGHDVEWHPTVKPLDLMRWLVRLVGGQPGSLILDPFGGTGTTGEAALAEGFAVILIEREPAYARIAETRLRRTHGILGFKV